MPENEAQNLIRSAVSILGRVADLLAKEYEDGKSDNRLAVSMINYLSSALNAIRLQINPPTEK